MSFLSNAHTHTTYCDGRSTIAEQLAAAQALGFKGTPLARDSKLFKVNFP